MINVSSPSRLVSSLRYIRSASPFVRQNVFDPIMPTTPANDTKRVHESYDDKSKETGESSSMIILGDAFADLFCFLDGDLPKEAGGDTRLSQPIRTAAGGSGLNTATHYRSLDNNAQVHLHTALNDSDPYGILLNQHANEHGFSLHNCCPEKNGSTGHCAVLVANGDRSFLTHLGVMETFEAHHIDVGAICDDTSSASLHVHVAGYFNIPGFWDGKLKQTLHQIQDRIRQDNRKVATSLLCQYDATEQWDGQLLNLLPMINYLFVNELEARNIARGNKNTAISQLDEHNENEFVMRVASFYNSVSPNTCIVLTLGPRGAYALQGGEIVARQPAPMAINNPLDPTGAGDAFIAGFMYGTLSSSDDRQDVSSFAGRITRGLLYGCAVGTSCVMRSGASNPAPREEIDNILIKSKEVLS